MRTEPKSTTPAQTPIGARARFAEWVKDVGGSLKAARLLDVSRSYVDMMKNGQRSPGLHTARKIERLTGGRITMQGWIVE